jgi:hypothetical protein
MRGRLLTLGFLLLSLVPPAVPAQEPVDECASQCHPTDPDVNDPAVRNQGPVNVILYAHWDEILQWAPMNPSPPDPRHEHDLREGFLMPTLTTSTGCEDCNVHFKNNVFTMSVVSGPLAFDENGVRCPIGCTNDGYGAALQGDTLVAYAYFSADSVPEQCFVAATCEEADQQTTGGIVPNIRVLAEWRQGASDAYPGGLVATGVSDRVDLLSLPSEELVYEMRIELRIREGLNATGVKPGQAMMHVEPYQLDTGTMEFMQREWRARTGPDFPWRVILPVAQPLSTENLTLTPRGDEIWIVWHVASPLGFTDVDFTETRLNILDSEGRVLRGPYYPEAAFCNGMECHFQPVRFAWRVPMGDLVGKPSGTLQLSVLNGQGTYRLEESLENPVILLEGEAKSPLPGLPFLLMGLVLVAAWRRR